MLNQNSLALARTLAEEYTPQGPMLPKPSFWDNLLSLGKKTLKTGARFASEAGILPLESEIANLAGKKAQIRGLSYQMDDILNRHVMRLSRQNKAGADALAKSARQAKAQGYLAVKALDAAVASGENAQARIRNGELPATAVGAFTLKKMVAERIYGPARLRLDNVVASWHDIERRLVASESLVKGAGQAAYQTAREAGGIVSRGLVRVGQGVREFGKGAEAAIPYMKYAPYVLGAFAVLYGLQFLPRARRE